MNKEMTTLGESCQFFNGRAHEKDIDEKGAFVVVNSKFISRDGKVRKYTGKQMFPLFEDDIVMVMSDVPNGKALAKCYIIEEKDKYSLNQRICAIRTTKFNIRFLYYQLNRHPFFLAFNNGENQSNLRKNDILNCPLWKPSIEEQKQIVAILDEAFAAIDQAKANIEKNIVNAKELFQSKLNDIFSQTGDGWEEKTLGEVVDIIGGGTPSKKREEFYIGDIPWATVRDMNTDKLRNTRHSINEAGLKNSSSNVIPKDNIIIATRVGLGKVCVLKQDTAINQDLKGLVPKPNYNILIEFIFWWFKSISHKVIKAGTGATVQGVKLTFVKKLGFPLASINEQTRVVTILNKISDDISILEKKYDEKLKGLEELKKSILQKAFAGELTN